MSASGRSVVAVVDDDESMQESLRDLLESAGYQACTFGSARAFLDGGDLHFTDCLVTDLRMPDIDGWQLADAARRERPGLPVVFVTGHSGPIDPPNPGTTGIVLRKPLDGRALLETIRLAVAGL